MAFFPRLTLLFSSVATGGILWWLGFLFIPRFLVAFLATAAYLETNPILVILAWIWAISGESTEKVVVIRNRPFRGSREPRPMKDVKPIN